MIKQLFFGVLSLSVLTSNSQVVPNVDWVENFSEKLQVGNFPSAIDANNNAYITGYTYPNSPANQDATTIKYAPTGGAPLWVAHYDFGGVDNAKAIIIDAASNVYITGESDGIGTGRDLFVVKYDQNGNQLFSYRYNGASNGNDVGNAITVDPSGNIFVTGYTTNMGGFKDYVTIKLNSAGVQQFAVIYNGTGNLNDEAVAIAFNNNRLYVTGNATNLSGNTDIVTLRLNANTGNTMWAQTINGTSNSNDVVNAILAYNNDVVIVGQVANLGTNNDYVTTRYNGNTGNVQWNKIYDDANSNGGATALTVDATGNFAVTGIVNNAGVIIYHTLLYNNNGVFQWVNKVSTGLNFISANPQIAVDGIANHFYVCGQKLGTQSDIFVYQITPSGNKTWEETFNGAQNGPDAAVDLVVNTSGQIYVAGASLNSNAKFDYTTIKISQTPVYFPIDLGTPEIKDPNFVFQQNKGQLLSSNGSPVSSSEVEYYNQGSTPSYYINNSRLSSLLINNDTTTNLPDSLERVDMTFAGSNSLAKVYSFNPIDAKKHYLIYAPNGVTDVVSPERLFIPNLYPNVDLHYYSNTRGLKSYFVFKNAESLNVMRIVISGAISTTIAANGDLLATTNLGVINYGSLTAYQPNINPFTMSVTAIPVASASWQNIGGNTYKFNVTGFNAALPVVVYFSKQGATSATSVNAVDNIYWSTFIGGQGSDTWAQSKVDAKDNYYTVGKTTAINFPVFGGPFQNQPPSSAAAIQYGIMSKFDKDGAIKYSTYFGGTNPYDICGNPSSTQILDVAVDSTYNMYIVGRTTSTSMFIQPNPAIGGLNTPTNSANTNISGGCTNAFIAKIQAPGNALWYSSYYGGNKSEYFTCVKYMNGQIYLGGVSRSTTITLNTPLPNTYQLSVGDGGMYMHLDTSGTLKHVTKLQGFVRAGDADKNGNYYLVSDGALNPVPVITPASSFYGASAASVAADWGIQRFSIADSLTWSTNYGGTGNDYPYGISIRDTVMAVVGRCDGNFPIVKSVTDSGDVVHANGSDISLVKFNTKTGQRLWSVLHATGNNDDVYACALDKNYNLFVTGTLKCGATNTLFPCVANNFKNIAAGGYYNQPNKIGNDAFLVGYNNKNQRKWTTNFGSLTAGSGGFNYDAAYCIAVNNQAKLFIAGETDVKNNSMPLSQWNNVCYYDPTVADPANTSAYDAFITMFDVANFVAVGIKEESKIVNLTNNISLYPNPNNGIFTLKFKEQPNNMLDLNVINIVGQKVYELSKYKIEANEFKIDLSHLTKGIYFISVNENNTTNTIKFIVQ